ncbi:hypothetical protein FH972_019018 [Carpinus fangiana]|uniref:Uncharacterized protein n=1 Tax=Carpinus fangiana TaxID=176857 RepID=A0A5N6RP02_9ROSI|nr:hypothetical protein FH972_019018 [Carpinus fangiana]
MGGPPSGGDPELRRLLSNMGFRHGVNPSAPRAVDLLLRALGVSGSGFLYHSQHRLRHTKLHLLSWDRCGHHEGEEVGGRARAEREREWNFPRKTISGRIAREIRASRHGASRQTRSKCGA